MNKTMWTFVMKRVGEVGMMEKPTPRDPGPLDAIVKTQTALICTSDVHTVHGAVGERANLTLGHEACGIVDRVGSEVLKFKPGDRVVVNAITPCYICESCQLGYTSQCTQLLGGWKFAHLKDGTFAEYFHVNNADANLTHVPFGVSNESACYCSDMIMMSTGFGGAEKANIPAGGTVAVFGVGPVGIMAVAGARLRAAGLIIAVDKIPMRLGFAREYGADVTINFALTDPIEEIMKITNGVGLDSAIECVGDPDAFANCVRAVRPGGTICNVGYHSEGDSVLLPRLGWGVGMGEKVINSVLCPGGNQRMSRLLQLLDSGRIDPKKLTTHRFKFPDIERAFQVMCTKEDNVIKPLIDFE